MTHKLDSGELADGTAPREESRDISQLHPHPLNSQLFTDLSERELQLLADDILENGLQHAVEILPNGMLIAGHQRVRALKLNGETTVRCLVRYDLAKEGPEAVEERLIKDNLLRRQLGHMAKARAGEALVKLQRHGGRSEGNHVRDQVGKQLGISGRHLSRYLQLLSLPRILQDAIDVGSLPMATASRIAGLPPDQQEAIAATVEAGEDPVGAAARYLAKSHPLNGADAREPSIGSLAMRVLQECEKLQRCCSGPLEAADRECVENAAAALRSLLERKRNVRRRGAKSLA
jgi:ParB-like chromosome segregation protein Spo0J